MKLQHSETSNSPYTPLTGVQLHGSGGELMHPSDSHRLSGLVERARPRGGGKGHDRGAATASGQAQLRPGRDRLGVGWRGAVNAGDRSERVRQAGGGYLRQVRGHKHTDAL